MVSQVTVRVNLDTVRRSVMVYNESNNATGGVSGGHSLGYKVVGCIGCLLRASEMV